MAPAPSPKMARPHGPLVPEVRRPPAAGVRQGAPAAVRPVTATPRKPIDLPRRLAVPAVPKAKALQKESSARPRCRAPVPKAPPVEAVEAMDSERIGLDGGDPELVLTAQLAARLLRELLEAFRKSTSVEEARASVGANWGFPSSAAMTQCIEAQANATMTLRDA
eukprot:s1855_g5.t1